MLVLVLKNKWRHYACIFKNLFNGDFFFVDLF